jgi:cytochrome c-type biogenesis protein CcmH
MILFWLAAAAMSGAALLWILPALVRNPRFNSADQQQQNVDIARDRLRELDAAREAGAIGDEDYREARSELEQALALDLSQLDRLQADSVAGSSQSSALLPILLTFALPVTAGGIYLAVGEPGAIAMNGSPAPSDVAGEQSPHSVDEMMGQLQARLDANPDDLRGWQIYARSNMQLGRYQEAARAFARIDTLQPGDPDVLVQYADAEAMLAGGALEGKPRELLEQAIAINPDQPQGLWLLGMAADRRGELQQAWQHWSRLLPLLGEDPQSRTELQNMMRDLSARAGSQGIELNVPASEPAPQTVAAAADASILVSVTLDPAVAGNASPTDTVFVFARAVSGPPMPLAAARLTVADLPTEVILDDSSAMMPQMKLSSFEVVDVVARVSRSGQPTASSGDIEGIERGVSTAAAQDVAIVIANLIP